MQGDGRSWFSILAASHGRALAALLALSLLAFLPGFFTLPAVDRDEARFAQAARQMVETGDFVDIRLHDAPRHNKPVAIYWAQALAVTALADDARAPIWVHRLPSLAGAIASVLLTYWIAIALVARPAAFLAGAMMALSLVLGVEARLAKTDAALLAAILLCVGVLVRAHLASRAGQDAPAARWRPLAHPALFWTTLAAGILLKGPVILLYVGLMGAMLAAASRSLAVIWRLKPILGALWCLCLAAPWFVAIWLRTDGAYFGMALGHSVAGNIVHGHEGHDLPPLSHLAMFWASFWPGSLLVALALPGIWESRRAAWLLPLLCWAIPSWIAFELFANKLPHYVLPAMPAIAIAAAAILTERRHVIEGPILRPVLAGLVVTLAVLACAATIALAWWAGGQMVTSQVALRAGLALAACAAAIALAMAGLARGRIDILSAAVGLGTLALFALAYPALASIEWLWPSRAASEAAREAAACPNPRLASAGFEEASIVFNTRTDIAFVDGVGAARLLAGPDCAVVLVEAKIEPRFRAAAAALGLAPQRAATVEGFNIANSRRVEIGIYANRPGGGAAPAAPPEP